MAPAHEPTPPVSPGDLIANKYRVERVLGSGGMAFVIAARHEDLDQLVAIKILRPDLPDHSIAAGRFLREARAAARIQSDHVARVFDVGTTEAGHPFMVMEHLEGSDLDEVVLSGERIPIEDAVDYTLEALEAIAHAHALHVVHRDLKPANLFLAGRPGGSRRIKVLDFGISKASAFASQVAPGMVTAPNALLGSPAYMSPEQARSSTTVDRRTDLWSIGVILYELITGHHPFRGETATKMLASIASDAPIPLLSLRPDAPAALEKVILRCLERDLDARYQSAAEVAHALARFGSERTKAIPARISQVLGAPPPPRPSSPIAAVDPKAAEDDATADTLRSDDTAPIARELLAPMLAAAPPRTSPDPGTPSLAGSARDAEAISERMARRSRSEASAHKGMLIRLSLFAVAMLALGMIGAAAWQAAGRNARQASPDTGAPTRALGAGAPAPASTTSTSAAQTTAPETTTTAATSAATNAATNVNSAAIPANSLTTAPAPILSNSAANRSVKAPSAAPRPHGRP